jgi:hypothetical protein
MEGKMAVTGNLADLPLVDLLPVFVGQTGVLELSNSQGCKVEIWIEEGHIKRLELDNKPLDRPQARDLLIEWICSSKGSFAFNNTVNPEPGNLNWPVESVLTLFAVTFYEQPPALHPSESRYLDLSPGTEVER